MRAFEYVVSSWFFVAVAACSTRAPTAVRSADAASAPSVERSVDVGGTELFASCAGTGAPTVVLEAGLGNDHGVWSAVQPEIARFTRVCSYDRAGLGKSSPPAKPHSNRAMARELYALLGRIDVSPPYVLVAHSMGGINVRMFANEHPNDVAGMVLIDTVGDDQPARYWALLPEPHLAELRTVLSRLPEGLDYDTYVAGIAEMKSESRTLGDMPLVILTRGREDAPPDAPPELTSRMLHAWQGMQSELRKLSMNSLQVVAQDAGHFIQREKPELTIACVRAVVDSARSGGNLTVDAVGCGAR